MWPNPQETADLFIFTEEILNGKLNFFWQYMHLSLKAYFDALNQHLMLWLVYLNALCIFQIFPRLDLGR